MAKSKQVAPFAAPNAGALAALKNNVQGFVAANPKQVGGGLPFLRLLKGDGWHWGAEDNQVEEDSQWAVNVMSALQGHVCWTDHKNEKNTKLGEHFVGLGDVLPPVKEMAEHIDEATGRTWEWKTALSVEVTCISGDDKGVTVLYNPSSYGGLGFLRALFADVGVQFENDAEHPIPIIEFGSSHYAHKVHGRVYSRLPAKRARERRPRHRLTATAEPGAGAWKRRPPFLGDIR